MTVREVIAKRIIQLKKQRMIEKLCDAFEITLGELFSTPEFNEREQELR